MLPQVKEAERGQRMLSHRAFKGSAATVKPWFWTRASRTTREQSSVVSSTKRVLICRGSPRKPT